MLAGAMIGRLVSAIWPAPTPPAVEAGAADSQRVRRHGTEQIRGAVVAALALPSASPALSAVQPLIALITSYAGIKATGCYVVVLGGVQPLGYTERYRASSEIYDVDNDCWTLHGDTHAESQALYPNANPAAAAAAAAGVAPNLHVAMQAAERDPRDAEAARRVSVVAALESARAATGANPAQPQLLAYGIARSVQRPPRALFVAPNGAHRPYKPFAFPGTCVRLPDGAVLPVQPPLTAQGPDVSVPPPPTASDVKSGTTTTASTPSSGGGSGRGGVETYRLLFPYDNVSLDVQRVPHSPLQFVPYIAARARAPHQSPELISLAANWFDRLHEAKAAPFTRCGLFALFKQTYQQCQALIADAERKGAAAVAAAEDGKAAAVAPAAPGGPPAGPSEAFSVEYARHFVSQTARFISPEYHATRPREHAIRGWHFNAPAAPAKPFACGKRWARRARFKDFCREFLPRWRLWGSAPVIKRFVSSGPTVAVRTAPLTDAKQGTVIASATTATAAAPQATSATVSDKGKGKGDGAVASASSASSFGPELSADLKTKFAAIAADPLLGPALRNETTPTATLRADEKYLMRLPEGERVLYIGGKLYVNLPGKLKAPTAWRHPQSMVLTKPLMSPRYVVPPPSQARPPFSNWEGGHGTLMLGDRYVFLAGGERPAVPVSPQTVLFDLLEQPDINTQILMKTAFRDACPPAGELRPDGDAALTRDERTRRAVWGSAAQIVAAERRAFLDPPRPTAPHAHSLRLPYPDLHPLPEGRRLMLTAYVQGVALLIGGVTARTGLAGDRECLAFDTAHDAVDVTAVSTGKASAALHGPTWGHLPVPALLYPVTSAAAFVTVIADRYLLVLGNADAAAQGATTGQILDFWERPSVESYRAAAATGDRRIIAAWQWRHTAPMNIPRKYALTCVIDTQQTVAADR